jgi:hypothetical protein
MFRAILCSSSGGSIVHTQHLVPYVSLFLGNCSVHSALSWKHEIKQVMKVQKYKGNILNTRVRPLTARSTRTGVGKSRPKNTVTPDGGEVNIELCVFCEHYIVNTYS